MTRSHAALFLICAAGLAQNRFDRRQSFPPDIVIERFIDVVKIAPKLYSVDRENEKVRVLRAKLPGDANVSFHDHRSGLLVALTDVHLRFRTPDGKGFDLHVPAGETRWFDADGHAEHNLNNRPCEFLFVESKTPAEPPV
jgi:hypothetical protein